MARVKHRSGSIRSASGCPAACEGQVCAETETRRKSEREALQQKASVTGGDSPILQPVWGGGTASEAEDNPALHLILGGAAVYRCGKAMVLNTVLAAGW